jgi:hypothetical protein
MNTLHITDRHGTPLTLARLTASHVLANNTLVGTLRQDGEDMVLVMHDHEHRIRYADYLRLLAVPLAFAADDPDWFYGDDHQPDRRYGYRWFGWLSALLSFLHRQRTAGTLADTRADGARRV